MTELPFVVPASLLSKMAMMGIDTSKVEVNPEGAPQPSILYGGSVLVCDPTADVDGFLKKRDEDMEKHIDGIISKIAESIFNKSGKPPSMDSFFKGIFGAMGSPFDLDGIVAEPIPQTTKQATASRNVATPLPRAERPGVGIKGGTQRPAVDHPAPTPVREGMFGTTDNGVILRELGLCIVHIHKGDYPKAGMTICYRKPNRFASNVAQETIEISTAIVHPNDRFDRKIGTSVAIKNFQAGRTIVLPLVRGRSIAESLEMYFEPVAMR